MAAARSTKDLKNMIRANKYHGKDDNYASEEYDKLPNVDSEAKITYTDQLKAKTSVRASTGHLRNLSNYEKPPESIEFPNIKNASKNNLSQLDLEQKLQKLKNLSQNDKEMIDIQRKKLAQQKFEIEKLLKKIDALKRNYEGLSNSAITEKNDYLRLKRENEQYAFEVEKLRTQNEELSIREREYKEELENLLDVHKQLQQRIDHYSKESKAKTEETKKLTKQYDDKIKDLTASNKKLSEGFQKYRDDAVKKDDEINRLMDEINSLNDQLAAHRNTGQSTIKVNVYKQVEELTTENTGLREQLEKLQKMLEANETEYKTQIASLKTEAEQALKNNDKQGDLKNLESENQKLRDQLQEYEQKIEAMTKTSTELVEELNGAKRQITDKNMSIAEKEETIIKLRKQLEVQSSELLALKSGVDQQNSAIKGQLENMTQERTKLETQLSLMEKAKQDMDSKLKEKNDEYKDLERNMKNKLEYLHNDMEKQKKAAKQELEETQQKLESAQKSLASSQAERDKLFSENEKLKSQLESTQKKLDDLAHFKEAILTILKKILKCYEPITSNLSCLSCLAFLENPLMLICGHSICMKCFNAHSDPNSKDSIVFCEECKIETKNKELMESKVIEII